MDRKNVLFISPLISEMYKDVISELEHQGYYVDYIEDHTSNFNNFYLRGFQRISNIRCIQRLFRMYQDKQWKRVLNTPKYQKTYDYLLVIDGMSICPVLFDILRNRNKNIKCINYLYDSTYSLFRFDKHFSYFDKIYSFDKKDCSRYNISFMPIYWVPVQDSGKKGKYGMLGVGCWSLFRYNFFMNIVKFSMNDNNYIKLYHRCLPPKNIYLFKQRVYKLIGKKQDIPYDIYTSDLIIKSAIPSSEFRVIMASSDIILDTVNFDQDGMTARYMWATGLGKRIITTNQNASKNDFFDSRQVFVLKDIDTQKDDLHMFIHNQYQQTENERLKVLKFRIDNWIYTLLEC